MDLVMSFLRASWEWVRQLWKAPNRETGTRGCLIHVCFQFFPLVFLIFLNKNFLLDLIKTSPSDPFFCLCLKCSGTGHAGRQRGHVHIYTYIYQPRASTFFCGTSSPFRSHSHSPLQLGIPEDVPHVPYGPGNHGTLLDLTTPTSIPQVWPFSLPVSSVLGSSLHATSWPAADIASTLSVVSAEVIPWVIGMWNWDPTHSRVLKAVTACAQLPHIVWRIKSSCFHSQLFYPRLRHRSEGKSASRFKPQWLTWIRGPYLF